MGKEEQSLTCKHPNPRNEWSKTYQGGLLRVLEQVCPDCGASRIVSYFPTYTSEGAWSSHGK